MDVVSASANGRSTANREAWIILYRHDLSYRLKQKDSPLRHEDNEKKQENSVPLCLSGWFWQFSNLCNIFPSLCAKTFLEEKFITAIIRT